MEEVHCPDILTIQAFVDDENGDRQMIAHLRGCPSCRQAYREIGEMVAVAGSLKGKATLPDCFYETLNSRLENRPFPAIFVSVFVFVMALFSAYLLSPDYLQWWLSIGMTRQVGFMIDAFLDLFFLSQSIGQIWLIAAVAALVILEFVILNKLKTTEG